MHGQAHRCHLSLHWCPKVGECHHKTFSLGTANFPFDRWKEICCSSTQSRISTKGTCLRWIENYAPEAWLFLQVTAKTKQDVDIVGQSVVNSISQCAWSAGHQLRIPRCQWCESMGCAWLCFQEQRVAAGDREQGSNTVRCQMSG